MRNLLRSFAYAQDDKAVYKIFQLKVRFMRNCVENSLRHFVPPPSVMEALKAQLVLFAGCAFLQSNIFVYDGNNNHGGVLLYYEQG